MVCLVTFVTLLPNKYRRAEPQWPEGWRPPASPTAPPGPSPPFLTKLLRSNLYALMADDAPAPELAAELDGLAPRRAPREVAAYHAQWDLMTERARRPPKPKAKPRPRPTGTQHTRRRRPVAKRVWDRR